ncbi:hypothetical protein [Streptomyces platensis]|uniref:hypothetical protein n=1 Tax=Streptomyces platensis TaxID=58346 RepID=UPI003797A846
MLEPVACDHVADPDEQADRGERDPELLAVLLPEAVLTEDDGESATHAAVRTAGRRGRELGENERKETRPGRLGAERGLSVCGRMLDQHGFEPVRETPTQLRLHNCPFHPLAAKAPDLVCGMNHAFITGYPEGLEVSSVEATLAPRPAPRGILRPAGPCQGVRVQP